MPRSPRVAVGGLVYHALNRAVQGTVLFRRDSDYEAFEQVLEEACALLPMRVLAYCVMPNHWHFLLWPVADGDLSEFLRWLTQTHTQRYHIAHGSVGSGPIYQGRFKSFPVQSDEHLLTVARYVERNPLRAGLVERAEDWRWGSLWRRMRGDALEQFLLNSWPIRRPRNWVAWVNEPQSQAELAGVRQSIMRGRPFGQEPWVNDTAKRLGLESSLRPRGRPPAAT